MSQATDNLASAVTSAVETLKQLGDGITAARGANGDTEAQAAADALNSAVSAAQAILNPPAAPADTSASGDARAP